MPVQQLIDALSGNSWDDVEPILKTIESSGLWPEAIAAVGAMSTPHPNICSAFHSYWVERGFRVRAKVGNDALMLAALRILLPLYSGPNQFLYRGENLDRWIERRIGFAWTSQKNTAQIFAEGLAATEGSGGILLSAKIPADAIIAGPNDHSKYLGEEEYTIDMRVPFEIQPLQRYPRVY
jgi:hypothetical protein